MKVNAIIFSPTGATKKVGDLLLSNFDEKGEEIDLSLQDFDGFTANKDETYIIVAPVFAGRIPKIAIDNLKKINGNSAKAIAVATFGNRHYDDALLELSNVASESYFEVVSAIAASTEHSLWRQYGSGRPDGKDKEDLKGFTEKIKLKIEDNPEGDFEIPGNFPYKEYNRGQIRPETNDKCIECMKCVNSCPVKAIPKDDPTVTDDGLCFSCMRCVEVCPEHARLVPDEAKAMGEKMKDYLESRKENELYL